MLSNGAYFSRLRRYLSYIRKWSRWPEELARTSKRLWTVIMSATIAQAGAIRENDSAPTVFLSSTWQETRNKMDKQMAAETSRKNMMPFWENYLQLMQPQERTYFSFFRYKRIFISNAFKQYRTFYSGGIQFSVTEKSSNLQMSTPKIDTKWRKMLIHYNLNSHICTIRIKQWPAIFILYFPLIRSSSFLWRQTHDGIVRKLDVQMDSQTYSIATGI